MSDAAKPRTSKAPRLIVGCLGTLFIIAIGAAIAVALTLRVVQQRWEQTLRDLLAETTGDEVDFDELRIGLTQTALTQVEIRDTSGAAVLTAQELAVAVSPWALNRDTWRADLVRAEGVTVDLHRQDGRWGLPETTLGRLTEVDLQQVPWPELQLGVLDVQDLTLRLTDGERAVELAIPTVSSTSVTASIGEQLELALGPVQLPGISVSAPEAETIEISNVAAAVEPWTLGADTLTVTSLQVGELSADLGATGWRVPDAAVAILEGAEGIPWPTVGIEAIAVDSLLLQAGSGDERATARVRSASLKPTTLTVGPTPALAWGAVGTGAVTLSRGGTELVSMTGLSIGAGEIDGSATRLSVPWAQARGLEATLRKGERWFAVPTGTWVIFGRPGAPGAWSGLRIGTVELTSLDADIVAPSGTLTLVAESGEASAVGLDPSAARPWSVGSAKLAGLTAASEGETFATVGSVILGETGLLSASGAEVWTRLRKNRSIKLPPVVRDHAPSWVGGTLEDSAAPWFGVELDTLPWQPKQARITKAIIHLDDARNADPPLQWTVNLASASVGPKGKDHLPITATGTVAEGSFSASGGLYPKGKAVVDVTAKKLSLKELTPYVDDLLDAFGLKVKSGTVGGDLTLTLRGSKLKITGPARARRIELGGNSKTSGLANAALQAITGERTRVDLELNIGGDLTDGDFSPFRLVLAAVVGDLVGEASDAIGTLLEGLEIEDGDGDGGGGKKKKNKGNQAQAEQVIEGLANGLQSALTGGNNNNSGNNNSGNKKKNSGNKSGTKKKKKK